MLPLLLTLALSPAARAAPPQVLVAIPFQAATPWPHAWHAEHTPVHDGVVLVLEVDPADARPRDVGGPVLYVGPVPAERISWSAQSDHLVVVAPGPLTPETPVFWGPSTLPEDVDAAVGARAAAGQAAVGPVPLQAPWRVQDQTDLYRQLAPVVREWVPDDAGRVEGWDGPTIP
ncbi:MAG: hypothetical protein H6742_19755 [Alphaproteobacteria bacterium]|nr:hypothetical protein [Alphaproteobacteria bacterium]